MKTFALRTGSADAPFRLPNCPSNVMLDVTNCCNQACRFCYDGNSRTQTHPSIEQLNRIIEALGRWGVREVLYLGGEPALHPDLIDMLRLGQRLGLTQRMVTNGSLLDQSRAREFVNLGVEVGVTLHSVDPKVHDMLAATPGSHTRAVKAIEKILASGGSLYIQYTLTRMNTESLSEFANWLRCQFGDAIRLIDMTRLVPQGTVQPVISSFFPSSLDIWRAFIEIPLTQNLGFTVRTEAIPHCWVLRNAHHASLSSEFAELICSAVRPCLMGVDQLAFSTDGRIKLCPCLPPFGDSILDVSPAALWEHDLTLNDRRNFRFLPPTCLNHQSGHMCKRFYQCMGGCRACGSEFGDIADPLISESTF